MIYAGVRAKERARRAAEALEIVGLADRMRNLPNQLSGGQQQRVAIARALVTNPAIILADEPTGALDTRTSVELMEVFQKLNEERSMTIILVTHETDISEYSKRVVLFRDGRIVKDFPVAERRNATQAILDLPDLDEEDGEDDAAK
jgi:putative ABC transport system ATP-binding protein